MQKISSYLYSNRVILTANLTTFPVEFRIVYQRNLKIYRNIDNVIEFDIKNADQKRISLDDYTLEFIMTDLNSRMVFSGTATNLASTGLASITITEADTRDLDQGFYHYVLYAVDTNGIKRLLYGDTQFGAKGRIELVTDVLPEPRETSIVEDFLFNYEGSEYVGSIVSADPGISSSGSLHTVAFYPNQMSGQIRVEASLGNTSQNAQWVTLDTITVNTSDQLFYKNYNGVYSWFRFVYTKTAGTLDKILVRN